MTPPVITTEMTQKPMIEFKLFDAKTNQTFKGVTYSITIEKNNKQLLSNRFYNSEGDLNIQIQPKNTSNITISGQFNHILNAYTSQGSDNVLASGPVFLEGGLFHFIVKIIAIDNSKTILPTDKQPVFNGWLSVGVSQNKVFDIDGKSVPITILSYYDKINNIVYDAFIKFNFI